MLYAVFMSSAVLLAILAFLGEEFDISVFGRIRFRIILFALSLYVFSLFLNSVRTVLLLKLFGARMRFRDSFVNILLMQYLNFLTPFAAGGQPFQIYDLTKRGVELTTAAAVIITRYVVTSTSLLVLSFYFLPRYWRTFFNIPGIGVIAFLGAFFTFALLILLVTLSYSRFLLSRLVSLVTRPAFMKRILARAFSCGKEEVKGRLWRKFEEFNTHMVWIWKKGPLNLLIDLSLTVAYISIFRYTLFVIMQGVLAASATPGNSVAFLPVWGAQELLNLVVYYIPTPGASGATEAGLFFMLSEAVPREVLGVSLAVWRALTYHLVIIMGTVVFLTFARRRKKIKNTEVSETKIPAIDQEDDS